MALKRLLIALLICLALWPAAACAQTTGIANLVPIIYISDSAGPADALMDDDASTAWFGTVDPKDDAATWTVLVASRTVREIWIRAGARQSAATYLSAGRPLLLAVTVYYENQQVTTYRYRLNDAYAVEASRDWVDGYQRLLLPQAMDGVFCIELKVLDAVRGNGSTQIALSDILLSSGQPSPPPSGTQMRASAPTVRPVSDGSGSVNPTMPPQQQPSATMPPTLPPSSGQVAGVTAMVLKQLGVRSGPGTGYDYVGSFFQGGETVQVISKVWDPVNELYWDQVDFYSGGVHYRGYCVHELRINLDPSQIPDEQAGIPATVSDRTANYYGPGSDYKAHNDQVFATTKGTVYGRENGYVLFDWYDGTNNENRRAWIPETAIAQ